MKVANQSGDGLMYGPGQDSQVFNKEDKAEINTLQNGAVTKLYFEKLIKIEYGLAFSIITSTFLIIVSIQMHHQHRTHFDNQHGIEKIVLFCLVFNCINAIIAIVITTLRAITLLELQKMRKAIYQNSTLTSTKRILWLILESIIILIQPYPFFINSYFQTANSYQKQKFWFPTNDLLAILSLPRLFILFRGWLLITPYMNNRSNRLCKMYGCQANFSFSLKCLFKDNPLFLIVILFTSSALIFSYAVYLAQRNISPGHCQPNVACTYGNALWLVLMTITTVGYGDYFPQTPLGRIIIFLVAIWGTFIVSITVVVVANTLKMGKKQKETGIVIQKLFIRSEVKEKAGKLIGYSVLRRRAFLKGDMELKKIYEVKVKKSKKEFSNMRNKLKMMRNQMDLYDEIAANFLNLNDDIDILNRNQEKITNFIHEKLEFREKNRKQQAQINTSKKKQNSQKFDHNQ